MSKFGYMVFSLFFFLTDCPSDKYTMSMVNNSNYDLSIKFYQSYTHDSSVQEITTVKMEEGEIIKKSDYLSGVDCSNLILSEIDVTIIDVDSVNLYFNRDQNLFKIKRVPDFAQFPTDPWHNYDIHDPIVRLFEFDCNSLNTEIIFTNEYLEQAVKVEE